MLAKSPENAKHQIAIVKFAGNSADEIGNDMYNDYYGWWNYYTYNYSQVVKGLTEVTNTSAGELKAAVDELQATGATRADYGMHHAAELMPQSVSGRKQIVVMFTDGEPTSTNKFENSVANGGNGGNNGYYKKATGATDLSEIFSQITSEVGSTTVTLDSNAVMVDTVSDCYNS